MSKSVDINTDSRCKHGLLDGQCGTCLGLFTPTPDSETSGPKFRFIERTYGYFHRLVNYRLACIDNAARR